MAKKILVHGKLIVTFTKRMTVDDDFDCDDDECPPLYADDIMNDSACVDDEEIDVMDVSELPAKRVGT